MDSENVELSKIKCTRFYVETVDPSKNEEAVKLCPEESEKENHYARTSNSKYLTREALPRLDNYRHIMSIQAAYRPTLEDLHNPVSIPKHQAEIDEVDEETHTKNTHLINSHCLVELGWKEGVLIPNLFGICGAILFLRFVWIVTEAGLVNSILLVCFGGVVSMVTALSVCAIGTNGFIKEGGTYAMMSRSLGPEFGIPIGIVLLIGNVGLCSMYILGLTEYVKDLFGCCLLDCGIRDTRYFSFFIFTLVTLLVAFSFFCIRCSFFCTKIRNLLFAFIAAAFLYFVTSFSFGLYTLQVAPFNVSTLENNLFSKYTKKFDGETSVFLFFAYFYPAFAEFLGGINASGRLKDPLRTIPKGTILSIIIGVIVYLVTAVVVSGTVTQTTDSSSSTDKSNLSVFCSNYVCQQKPVYSYDKYNMWISLFGSVLCLCIMFLINWVTALITVLIVLGIYLFITYQKPDVNWGSSTQAQMYNNALLSVHALNSVADHVKNYRPQILVLSGLPSHRPPLVTFARLITKHLSLMICGHIHTNHVPQNEQRDYTTKARNWLKFHRIKAFFAQVDDISFEDGAKSLMQATGLGKLRPNVLLMGYKNNWTTSSKKDLDMYFNIIHKALDSHIAVCILRVKTGLDFSHLKVNQDQISKNIYSTKYEFNNVNQRINIGEPEAIKINDDGASKRKNGDLNFSELNDSYEDIATNDIYRYKDGMELSGDMINRVTQFQGKQKKGTIDVWWLYDDGGLTLLLPYIISTRRSWSSCKLRVFALSANNDTLEFEQRNMASLLSKFRIDYSDLTIFTGLMKKPQEETNLFYESLIKDFVTKTNDQPSDEKIIISETDLSTMQDKTNRHLRLRELLLEHSQDANLIVMTLPIPRKSVISAALYMSWLEALTQDMPPFLLVRGNQTSVLTFYT
ncbi:bumetanide-sensitive sodium-(potassium)-chloride cotransporter-like isoform X2 [Planococcus citri]|uniref:bumetanide-sensitive sodium-(potassium)-chloride cotransporter-like isoform X2 n=1 Tax=Planococcus citri TaxID=170843 RepID=UPI0031F97F6C